MYLRFMTIVCLITTFNSPLFGQDAEHQPTANEKKMVDLIRDYGKETFFVKSRNRFVERGRKLLHDAGYGNFTELVGRIIPSNKAGDLAEDKPMVIYDFAPADRDRVLEVAIKDATAVHSRVPRGKQPEKLETWPNPLPLEPPPVQSDWLFPVLDMDTLFGIADKGQLALGLESENLVQWKSKPLLKHKLPQRTQAVINESGVGFIFPYDEDLKKNFPEFTRAINFTEDELTVQEQFVELEKAARLFVAGSTYEEELVEINLHTQFEKNEAVGKIFNLDESRRPFQSTLGLPAEGLVVNVSVNLASLRSPSVVRILLRQVADIFENSPIWKKNGADSALLKVSGNLVAEAWHNVSTVRAGLYLVDEGKPTEAMAIFAVIEPRNSSTFLEELSKVMALVDESKKPAINEKRAAEINQWIGKLDDNSYETRKRATTRLMLAGIAAEPLLEKAAKSGSPERRTRIRMVLRQMRTDFQRAANAILAEDEQIWHKIQPSYSLRKNAGQISGYEFHEILIDHHAKLDSNKREQYENEMKAIFGPHWSTIKLVRVKDRFVLMVGSNDAKLEQTIENLVHNNNPIRDKNNRRVNDLNQLEINASIPRLFNLINFDNSKKQITVNEKANSSVGLAVDDQTWELSFHFPIHELKVFVRSWLHW